MSGYMLDTDVCALALRERSFDLQNMFAMHAEDLCLSTIVLNELLVGAAKSMWPERRRHDVDHFASRMKVLPFDVAAADHAADIRANLERQGRMIGNYDVLIAGHARSRGLVIVTGNTREFQRVDGLRCENWFPDRDGFHEDGR
jgi:tRNA(fMet)-specific endonuclease VapC